MSDEPVDTTATPPTATPPPPSRLKLIYDDTQSYVAASIPVQWCVDASLYNELAEKGITRPYLLIEVRPYSMVDDYAYEYNEATQLQVRTIAGQTRDYPMMEDRRYIVPLTQELQYIRFNRSGMNEVFAEIVWIECGSEKHAIRMLEEVWIRNYHNEPLPTIEYGDGLVRVQVITNSADTFDVEVPVVMFAREYPGFVSDYLHKLFPSKADDECSMRGRLLVGVAIAPLAAAVAYLGRLGILILATVMGFLPGLDLRGFLHPIRYEVWDMVRDTGRSLWWMDKDEQVRPIWAWSLNPITPVVVWLFVVISSYHTTGHGAAMTEHYSWLYAAKISIALHLGWVALFTVADMLVSAMLWINGWEKKVVKPDTSERAEELARLKAALEAMSCDRVGANGKGEGLSALPPEKRTWKLRYQKTKARVCKPFAK